MIVYNYSCTMHQMYCNSLIYLAAKIAANIKQQRFQLQNGLAILAICEAGIASPPFVLVRCQGLRKGD